MTGKISLMKDTGIEAYELMRSVMGNQLRYVHSGDEVTADIISENP